MSPFRVFLSHYSKDREIAIELKHGIERSYLKAVDVFVSSDLSSLDLGTAWFSTIVQNLSEANIVLVLVTPEAIARPWINFEAGGGYLLKKPVIPLCFQGATVSTLLEPLHSLGGRDMDTEQGFAGLFATISKRAGLDVPEEATITKVYENVTAKAASSAGSAANQPSATETSAAGSDASPTESATASETLPFYESSELFFLSRMNGAFPGVRDLEWICDPEECVYRLSLLLKAPFMIRTRLPWRLESIAAIDAIWWFRGYRASTIQSFAVLSPTRVLIGHYELELDRVAVYRNEAYYRDFVYLEAKAESPLGIYGTSTADVERMKRKFGYASEEYGLLACDLTHRL